MKKIVLACEYLMAIAVYGAFLSLGIYIAVSAFFMFLVQNEITAWGILGFAAYSNVGAWVAYASFVAQKDMFETWKQQNKKS
ncbi:MAG: hypothetical protein UV20_C0050G0002 [Candidatus Magasanikbacteria bacterium GW2011_GWA2_42_32]|uniref:Uncharacterized protein n=1 Tax=Candidatus Magasanikbacteria bacterium GW2011_GWA2_42_32 TaxID=1619039 RepID=A0A0G0ZXS2_9BACT|nr:MAG: hypothetical protein UV20_C0050G0002 [Candidatus Magasanikbacteria bacterium GW2011_GWA2_42_32]